MTKGYAGLSPLAFVGGTIKQVIVDVNVELEVQMAMMRDQLARRPSGTYQALAGLVPELHYLTMVIPKE